MEDYKVEIVKIHPENPYVKVHLNVNADMKELSLLLCTLAGVHHVNITSSSVCMRESLIVYPMKTFSIEEVQTEVEGKLVSYFGK